MMRESLRLQAIEERWPLPRPMCKECDENEAECPETDHAGEQGLCSRCYLIDNLSGADEEMALACIDEGPLPP